MIIRNILVSKLMIIREILVSNLREDARRWMLSEDRKIRSNGPDDLNLLHQTCSKDVSPAVLKAVAKLHF
jgi:hypothetical protein